MFLQGRNVGAEALELSLDFAGVGRRVLECRHVSTQDLELALQLSIDATLLGALGDDLRQALVQVHRLPHHALLLLALLQQLAFQLPDLQLERFAVVGDMGLAGYDLAGNILQTPGRFFTDPGEAFLSGHQLLLHQRNLLEAPPGKANECKEQCTDQCPQRPGTRPLDLRRRARMHAGALAGSGRAREVVVIEAVRAQARYIIEVVVCIVTHGH
ncbi:hypothetical protein D3C78_826470 [compost metagenome]